MIKNKIIAVDFDGTCVTHSYPDIGYDVGAQEVLELLVANGNRLILFTMRSGDELREAADWFHERNIPLFGINENPEQYTWTASPKPYAHLYIDDAALGCPLLESKSGGRPYVDWPTVKLILEKYDG